MIDADIKGSLYSLRGRYITKATFGSVVTYVKPLPCPVWSINLKLIHQVIIFNQSSDSQKGVK